MKVIAVGENVIDYYYEINEAYIGGNYIDFLMNLKMNSNFIKELYLAAKLVSYRGGFSQ